MLTLIAFPPSLGIRSPSPPCLKAETYLAMSGLPYKLEYGNVRKAPRQKFPVLQDGDKLIPDSSHIQEYLRVHHGFDPDAGLSEEKRAVALAFQRLLEDHHYFLMASFRWNEHPEQLKNELFAEIPNPLRSLVFSLVRRSVKQTLHLQGIGRHTREERIAMARTNLDAISTQLGSNEYFLGNVIRSVDATVFAHLEGSFNAQVDTPMRLMRHDYQSLLDYCDRMRWQFFGEGATASAADT